MIERRQAERLRTATAVVAGATVVWNLIGNLVLPSGWYVPANLAVAGTLVMVARRAGLTWDELGFQRDALPSGLRWGLAAAGVVVVVLAIGLAVPATERALERSDVAADASSMRWLRPLVRIPLGTAVFEEVLFRSVWFGLLVRRWGTRVAVVGTALLFGLWHVVPAWETADGSSVATLGAVAGTVVATAGAGLVFGLLRERSRSLLAPVLAHWATNSLAYAAALVALEVVA